MNKNLSTIVLLATLLISFPMCSSDKQSHEDAVISVDNNLDFAHDISLHDWIAEDQNLDACKSDQECENDAKHPYCDTSSGTCVECVADQHCKDSQAGQKCLLETHSCGECIDHSDCKTSPFGSKCMNHFCSCEIDTDCKNERSWGNKCLSYPFAGETFYYCGCENDSECTANTNGLSCFISTGTCSCNDNNECNISPYSICSIPSLTAPFKHCHEPCKDDSDCFDQTLPYCNKDLLSCVACNNDSDCNSTLAPFCSDTHQCVECNSDNDCNMGYSPYCDASTSKCIECRTDSDCSNREQSPYCSTNGNCMECKTNQDCINNSFGEACINGECLCASDQVCASDAAFGKKCIIDQNATSGICKCKSDTDCGTTNENGSICTSAKICGCNNANDCKDGYKVCELYPSSKYTFSLCHKECESDTDCVNRGEKNICETSTHQCIECNQSSDCSYYRQENICETSTHQCIECNQSLDCTNNPYAFGPTCETSNHFCTCASDVECSTNPNGKKCNTILNACSCVTNSDCPSGSICLAYTLGVYTCVKS